MSRHQQDPLRPLTADERQELARLSRSLSAPAAHVERSRALLAIADGASYTAAAHQIGRRHNETISAWVSRFNRDGLAEVAIRRTWEGGGSLGGHDGRASGRVVTPSAAAAARSGLRNHARFNASGTGGRCGPSPLQPHGRRVRSLRGWDRP